MSGFSWTPPWWRCLYKPCSQQMWIKNLFCKIQMDVFFPKFFGSPVHTSDLRSWMIRKVHLYNPGSLLKDKNFTSTGFCSENMQDPRHIYLLLWHQIFNHPCNHVFVTTHESKVHKILIFVRCLSLALVTGIYKVGPKNRCKWGVK